MARIAFKCTLGQSLGEGRFNSSAGAAGPIADAITAVQALQTAVDDAQAAAEANGTIAGDGTALGLVQAIGTAFAAYVAAVGTAATAASADNAILDIDDAVLTTKNAVRHALRTIMATVEGTELPS